MFDGGWLDRKLDALYRIYKAQIWVQRLVECLRKIKQTLKAMNKTGRLILSLIDIQAIIKTCHKLYANLIIGVF